MDSRHHQYISPIPWELDSIAEKPMWFPLGSMIHTKDTDEYFQMMIVNGDKTWVRIYEHIAGIFCD